MQLFGKRSSPNQDVGFSEGSSLKPNPSKFLSPASTPVTPVGSINFLHKLSFHQKAADKQSHSSLSTGTHETETSLKNDDSGKSSDGKRLSTNENISLKEMSLPESPATDVPNEVWYEPISPLFYRKNMHQNNKESGGIGSELSDVQVVKNLNKIGDPMQVSSISSTNTDPNYRSLVTYQNVSVEAETNEVQKTLNDMLAEFCSGKMRALSEKKLESLREMHNRQLELSALHMTAYKEEMKLYNSTRTLPKDGKLDEKYDDIVRKLDDLHTLMDQFHS